MRFVHSPTNGNGFIAIVVQNLAVWNAYVTTIGSVKKICKTQVLSTQSRKFELRKHISPMNSFINHRQFLLFIEN